jgi:hypothetical protein
MRLAIISVSGAQERPGQSSADGIGIENGRINPGVERAKALAIALDCHPAVLVFPGWPVPAAAA